MAVGVLIELGIAKNIEEAINMVKKIRPEVEIHPLLISDLRELYPDYS
ncbi:hypothetical protein H1D32_16285 [Anaerobacillus sp. CMMVII]|nr:hypothetical protein [Anaerobacillus sp. CMMVII]MCT8139123.1 hypothetical protein [Anaerobacillus sp. CMMVII]